MARRIDTRDPGFVKGVATSAIAARVRGALPTTEVADINAMTGTATALTVVGGTPGAIHSEVERAVEFLRTAGPAFAFGAEAPPDFVPDPHVVRTTSGAASVHLQQQHRGVPVFQMTRTVRFAPDGALEDAVGTDVPLPASLSVEPHLGVRQAARAGASHFALDAAASSDGWGQPLTTPQIDVSRFDAEILAAFPLPSRPTVLAPGPFAEPVPAQLVLFYQGPQTRLGWHMTFTLPGQQGQYVMIVSADRSAAELLYCEDASVSMSNPTSSVRIVRGLVFRNNPSLADREMLEFPLAVTRYPLNAPNAPAGFPYDWVDGHVTSGECTIAELAGGGCYTGRRVPDEGLTFSPEGVKDDDQKVLNIFYFCNYMHDFFYLLGFDEAAGNFQHRNPDGVGLGGDPVKAYAHPGIVRGTANMLTPVDGMSPTMNMGMVAATGEHTALDADVVFHEFVHGVTNRLVGGRLHDRTLEQPQSRGMGEGWSDYFALTIQNHGRATERDVIGAWVSGRPAGIRQFPYDANFPDGFATLGTGRYTAEAPHAIGEIWCATLMQMNRNLTAVAGDKDRGHELGWQIVVDALKLTPANPSFLDARDAILRALEDMSRRRVNPLSASMQAAARAAIWAAFAKFGMGPNARTNAAWLSGIHADTQPPA